MTKSIVIRKMLWPCKKGGGACQLFKKQYFKIPIWLINVPCEMFVRMLALHCDENNSYEITMNCYQARKMTEIRNVIFGLHLLKPSSALRPKLGCSPSWVLDEIQIFSGKTCLNNENSWPKLLQRKIWNNLNIPFFWLSDLHI